MIKKKSAGLAVKVLTLCAIVPAAAVAVSAVTPLHEAHPFFELLSLFAAPALVLAATAFVLALASRKALLVLGSAAVAFVLALVLRPQWVPDAPAADPASAVTRVYFANVWVRNDRPGEILRSIAEADADVVALVEATQDHADVLDILLDRHPHRLWGAPAERFQGAPRHLIASKHPIRLLGRDLQDGLAVLEAEVDAPSGPMRLIVVHMTRPWPFDDPRAQERQRNRLVNRLQAGPRGRTLLVGDFNSTPAGCLLEDLRQRAGMTPAPAALGTWPSPLPGLLRLSIDNAYVGEELTFVSRRLGAPNGSDHRPIVVEVARAAVAVEPAEA